MYLCVCVCLSVYVHVYVCVCLYVYVCVYVCMYVCMCLYVCGVYVCVIGTAYGPWNRCLRGQGSLWKCTYADHCRAQVCFFECLCVCFLCVCVCVFKCLCVCWDCAPTRTPPPPLRMSRSSRPLTAYLWYRRTKGQG